MKLNVRLTAALNIKEGEIRPIIALMLISFFMGTAVAFFYTATTSMFLAAFKTQMLPYAYIGSGVLGYLIWIVSSALSKKVALSSMLMIYLSFLTITVLLFFIGLEYNVQSWIPFLMFVWIRVFTYVNAVVFWTLAGRIFDLRQAKRLFGLVSTGEVISTIIGFFSIPFLLKFIQVTDLILISVCGLILCLFILLYIIKNFKEKLVLSGSVNPTGAEGSISIRELIKNRYFKLMFMLAVLPMFAIYFVDFIFLTQTKIEYPDKNFLAGFLGIFFGIAAIAELVIKIFLSGRLISRYGIKPGLAALPLIMLFSTLFASASGSLFGLAGLFYSFIALTKFSERVIRSSITEPTFQILYQPLPADERLSFQNRIEGIPKAMGNVAGGIVLLIFSNLSFFNILHYNYVFILILVFWVKMAIDMYVEYRESLRKLLDRKPKKSRVAIEDESDLTEFFQDLAMKNHRDTPQIYKIYNSITPIKAEEALIRLLMQSNEILGQDILSIIRKNKYINIIPVLEYCMNDEELRPLRSDLEYTFSALKLSKDLGFNEISGMSESEDAVLREDAAILLGYSSKYRAVYHLQRLIRDRSIPVCRAALISAGRLKRTELWNDIIECLHIPSLSNAAVSAIRNIGEPILDELENYIERTAINRNIFKRVIKLYGSVGGNKAVKYLVSRIYYPDKEIREQVLLSLSKIGYQASSREFQILKEIIKEEIGVIIWIMAAISDISSYHNTEKLETALSDELRNKKNNLFSVLCLLYDAHTIQLVRESMNSGNPNSRTYGLEIIDLMVSPDIKEILIPLFEESTIADYLELYRNIYPQQQLTVDKRLEDIINKEYDKLGLWPKVCAIELIPEYQNKNSLNILAANVVHKDALIREISALALNKLSPSLFSEIIDRLPNKEKQLYADLNIKIQVYSDNLLLFLPERIKLLKKIPFLSELHESLLKEIIIRSDELSLLENESLSLYSDENHYGYMLIGGSVITDTGNIISSIDIVSDLYAPLSNFRALEDSAILRIQMDILFELMADYPELAKSMLSFVNLKTILD